jgi:hypothetical protein
MWATVQKPTEALAYTVAGHGRFLNLTSKSATCNERDGQNRVAPMLRVKAVS